jgi:hypothetical protein
MYPTFPVHVTLYSMIKLHACNRQGGEGPLGARNSTAFIHTASDKPSYGGCPAACTLSGTTEREREKIVMRVESGPNEHGVKSNKEKEARRGGGRERERERES